MPLRVGCSQKAEGRETNVDLRSRGHVGTAVMPRVRLHPREGVGNARARALQSCRAWERRRKLRRINLFFTFSWLVQGSSGLRGRGMAGRLGSDKGLRTTHEVGQSVWRQQLEQGLGWETTGPGGGVGRC